MNFRTGLVFGLGVCLVLAQGCLMEKESDRGTIAPGMKADVNIIDFDALQLHEPKMVHDLPAGGRRLIQEISGYRYTIVSGVITYENGTPTGKLPGKLIRGIQHADAKKLAAE